jgi:hypothetical protein
MVEAAATGDPDADIARPGALLGYASSVGHCMQVSLAAGGKGSATTGAAAPSWPTWPPPGSTGSCGTTPRPA